MGKEGCVMTTTTTQQSAGAEIGTSNIGKALEKATKDAEKKGKPVKVINDGSPAPADLNRHPMEHEAHKWWVKGNYDHYIPHGIVVKVAKSLGRQVTLEELQMIVGPDDKATAEKLLGRMITQDEINEEVAWGDDGEVVCSVTGKDFNPTFWVVIDPRFLNHLQQTKSVKKTVEDLYEGRKLTRQGHCYHALGERPWFSGTPFGVDKKTKEHHIPSKSLLVKAAHANAKKHNASGCLWGVSGIEIFLRKQRREDDIAKAEQRRKDREAELAAKAKAEREKDEQMTSEVDKLFFGNN